MEGIEAMRDPVGLRGGRLGFWLEGGVGPFEVVYLVFACLPVGRDFSSLI